MRYIVLVLLVVVSSSMSVVNSQDTLASGWHTDRLDVLSKDVLNSCCSFVGEHYSKWPGRRMVRYIDKEHNIDSMSVVNNYHEGTASISALTGDNETALSRGTLRRSLGAHADAVRKNNNLSMTGHIDYSNWLRKNVRWNETSDVELVYPYLTVDTMGGDVNGEKYDFGGRLFFDKDDSWQFSMGLEYDAKIEHRDVDPRPKNITSDLSVIIGTRCNKSNYYVGLDVYAGKYKQANALKFFDSAGRARLYNLMGLTHTYTRFDDNGLESDYDGYKVGASMLFGKCCLVSNLGYSHWNVEKSLGLTSGFIPLSDLNVDRLSLFLNKTVGQWNIYVDADYSRRLGTEIIYGKATGGASYEELTRQNLYICRDNRTALSLSRKCNCSEDIFQAESILRLGYTHRNEEYARPAEQMVVGNMEVAMMSTFFVDVIKSASRNPVWSVTANLDYRWNVDGRLGINRDALMAPMAVDNYRSLTSGQLNYGVKAMVVLANLLFFDVEYSGCSAIDIKRHRNNVELRVGYGF